ncbi:hypothetical protein, partial [Burkholderia gladioli]|uniref:hypothetical protein n=1 Tax=Burkholderia gladioli TaxID=28095 RepID=UPI001ABAD633
PNCSSSSAGIAGNSAGVAFGLRGIGSPWDKNMPRTQNYGQAPCGGRAGRTFEGTILSDAMYFCNAARSMESSTSEHHTIAPNASIRKRPPAPARQESPESSLDKAFA